MLLNHYYETLTTRFPVDIVIYKTSVLHLPLILDNLSRICDKFDVFTRLVGEKSASLASSGDRPPVKH